jgi:hypothetical protein
MSARDSWPSIPCTAAKESWCGARSNLLLALPGQDSEALGVFTIDKHGFRGVALIELAERRRAPIETVERRDSVDKISRERFAASAQERLPLRAPGKSVSPSTFTRSH